MYANQLSAYKKIQKSAMTNRELEASVLSNAAFKLKSCQEDWENSSKNKLDEALKYNQMVWSLFQSELVKKENPLPKNVKQDLLNLSLFIDKRIFEIMAYPEPAKLTVLIEINRNIAAGLRTTPKN